MSICFFTAQHVDGSGDIVQTSKIADFIQQIAVSYGYTDNIVIVIPDTITADRDHKAITLFFISNINPAIQVQTISEFKQSNAKIDCCIEAGYLESFTFDWKKEISELLNDTVPAIFMPEYGNDIFNDGAPLKIYGGFSKRDSGVIPSQNLLEASALEQIPTVIIQNAFEQLDPKLKRYLGQDFTSYTQYRVTHGFTYQYSHDTTEHNTFYYFEEDKENKYKSGPTYRSVDFFLQEHIMLVGDTSSSQDVLCIGKIAENKKNALKGLQKSLIEKGYTKITFVDVEQEEEELIYADLTLLPVKEYRVLYLKSTPFSSMQALPLLVDDLVGVTGDNSLVEAMSAGKLISYECMIHKEGFIQGYLDAVCKEATISDISLLAKLLIKQTGRAGNIEYNAEELQLLLKNKELVTELKKINRTLIARSNYFKKLKDILEEHVFKKKLSIEDSSTPTSALKNSTNQEVLTPIIVDAPTPPVNTSFTVKETKVSDSSDLKIIESNNSRTPKSNVDISMQILSGFIAVVGCAAVATAFILLNAASMGTVGLVVAGIGAALVLASVGLFATSGHKDRPIPAPLMEPQAAALSL